MDLSTLVVTMAAVFVLVELVKQLLPKLSGAGLQLVVLLLGIGAVFVMAATQWSHTEVFRGISLDQMNFWSRVVTGLFVGAGATVGHRIEQAVRNVGSNAPPDSNENG